MEVNVIKGTVPATPEEANYEGERLKVLDNHFQEMYDKKEIISASYCLSRNNKIFADNSMGRLSYEENDPRKFQPDTIFRIASITKLITAAAICKLAEDGKIRLDQPVGEIIPEFNTPPYQDIQIAHLLMHTSGLIADGGVYPNKYYTSFWELIDEKDHNSWITAILKLGLRTAPGVEWSYSSAGYRILGEIITRVSGIFCHDYIEQNILIPCEMMDSSFGRSLDRIDRYNIRDEWSKRDLEELRKNGENPPKYKTPQTQGGIYSTARDLVKFGTMLVNYGTYNGKRILGRKAIECMRRVHTPEHVKDYCWGAKGVYKSYGLGPEVFSSTNVSQLITPGVITHEGYGTCCIMVDFEEHFVAVWSAQFYGENWYAHALRNVASIIWSGII